MISHHSFTSIYTVALLAIFAGCGADKPVSVSANSPPAPAAPAVAKPEARMPVLDVPPDATEGEDWPQFLGPLGTGVSGESGLLRSWPAEGPPVLWKRKIGTGYSAPSILGNRLVVHHRQATNEVVECLTASTGEPVWKHSYESDFRDPYGYNNGPRASPALTETRCYTLGAEGALTCVDLESGEPVWKRDLQEDYDLPDWFFGMGCSPLLVDDMVIVLVGGQPDAGVVAFNAASGEPLWNAVGRPTWDGAATGWNDGEDYEWTGNEHVISYSTPFLAEFHGQRHLLCVVRHGLVSLNPATGKERFKYWFRAKVNDSVNAARPVVIGNRILLSAAYEVGAALLEVSSDGNSVQEVWRDRRNLRTHWSTAIHVDGFIYGFSGRHEQGSEFRCLELETGKVRWSTTGFEGDVTRLKQDPISGDIIDPDTGKSVPFPFLGRGSKIRVGDQFIVLGERGTLALANINSEKYDEVGRTAFPEIRYPAWAAPVLSRKKLYLRSEKWLVCLDLANRQNRNRE